MTNPADNTNSGNSADPAKSLKLMPETEALVRLAVNTPGIQLRMVEEGARANARAAQGGGRIESEHKLDFAQVHKSDEEANLREARTRLNHTEPKIILPGKRAKVGFIGGSIVLLLLTGLLVVLWNENGAAAQALLSTGAFDLVTLERARMFMLTPVAVGIAFILGFKVLPPFVRRRAFLTACAALAIAFLTWAVCFAIQTEKFRNDASQAFALGADGVDNPSIEPREVDNPAGGWSAWLMFGCLSVIMALTTFIGHTGIDHHLGRYETWVTNPDHTRALDDVHAHEAEIRIVEGDIVAAIGALPAYLAQEEQEVTKARALYKSWKKMASEGMAFALAAILLIGCIDGQAGSGQTAGKMERWTSISVRRNTPYTCVFALSPLLPAAEKSIARQQLEVWLEWLANDAPVGSVIEVVDALECVPIARFEAVRGVSRIRRKALAKPALAVREFLAKPHPRAKDDGRINLPRLAQTAKQWGLPAGSHIVVLGNPLFLNDGKDKFFSMANGRVPSDGCLFEDAKLNIYSVQGREKALAGQFWHLGWSDDSSFEDDTHRQAVMRFWFLYFQGQSARLVTAQSSFTAAVEATRERATDPLMYAEPDANAGPAMVKIVKVQHEEKENTRPNAADEAERRANAERAIKEAEAAEKAAQLEREAARAQREKERQNELADIEAKKREAAEAQRQKQSQNDLANKELKKPIAARDQHGNVTGSKNDLINDGEMKGQRILIAKFFRDEEIDGSPLVLSLIMKGFKVEQVGYPLPPLPVFEKMLDKTQQFWLWSSPDPNRLPVTHLQAIVTRWREGRLPICLLADNVPYTTEAAAVLGTISPGCKISGDYRGEGKLNARSGAGGGFDPKSPLFHNITTLYEGATVSTVSGPGLVPVCYASDGSPLISTLQRGQSSRLIVHCGFTSFFRRYWDDAGVSRFAVNCAGWLSRAGTKVHGF